jgi:hypothetical protein
MQMMNRNPHAVRTHCYKVTLSRILCGLTPRPAGNPPAGRERQDAPMPSTALAVAYHAEDEPQDQTADHQTAASAPRQPAATTPASGVPAKRGPKHDRDAIHREYQCSPRAWG